MNIKTDWKPNAENTRKECGTFTFDTNMRGLEFTVRNPGYTYFMKLFVDDECLTKFAVNNTYIDNETETFTVEIPEIEKGEHKIMFEADYFDSGTYFEGVKFTEGSPLDKLEYEPTDAEERDTYNDLMTATDMLGRKVISSEEAGPVRDKIVGLFYWTWRNQDIDKRAVNLTKLLERAPEAEYDIYHQEWTDHDAVHWNEPFYGFYRNDDPYVIRKHMQYFADAGVDVIFFDNTNGCFVWFDACMAVIKEMERAKADGIKVPKFAFMLPFYPGGNTYHQICGIYQDIYQKGLYRDLWFMWDGKPLVMAYEESLPEAVACDDEAANREEIREFFTWRSGQPLYAGGKLGGPWKHPHWGWLEIAPQNGYAKREDGTFEMCTVGVAQNARDGLICTCFNDKNTFGRSYTFKDKHTRVTEDSYLYGYNFQEQWDNAMKIDPEFVFITGWNEWKMGKWTGEPWIKDGSGQIAFVDQYDREHSRDIEPDIDGYLDTYYLQMASNIRRFKGLPHVEIPKEKKTITKMADWSDVHPDYISHKGTAAHRDYKGYEGYVYKNNTGRNDIVLCKMCYDDENIYAYAECSCDINKDGSNVMQLLIDADRDKSTGWEGYDFILDTTNTECVIEGNKMYYVIPRSMVGQQEGTPNIEFKWSDNIELTNVMNFYRDGDCAPFGRFNFVYRV